MDLLSGLRSEGDKGAAGQSYIDCRGEAAVAMRCSADADTNRVRPRRKRGQNLTGTICIKKEWTSESQRQWPEQKY